MEQRFSPLFCHYRKLCSMKHIVVLSICLCISIIFWAGCKKNQRQDKEVASSIIGNWELRKTTAAMNPVARTYSAGNGNLLKFIDNRYEKYVNGVLDKSGTYVIVDDATVEQSICLEIPADQYTHRIVYDNDNTAPKEFIEIINNTLYFISGCYAVDAGHTAEFQKQ